MKRLTWCVAIALLLGTPVAYGQQALTHLPPPGSALPPPGINAPGAKPIASESSAPTPNANDGAANDRNANEPNANESGRKTQSVPLPNTGIPPSLAPAAREAEGYGDSTNVRTHVDANGDTVEEFGHRGNVSMIRIIPKNGVTQTFINNNPNGSLMHDPALGPVAPVYYDIYKWDGPRKAPKPTSSGSTPVPQPVPQSASSSG